MQQVCQTLCAAHHVHAYSLSYANVMLDIENKAPASSTTSPVINALDEKTISGFPSGRPLDDKVDTVQCKHCRRPVLRASSATHIRECLHKKQEKLKKKKEAKEAKDAALRKEKGEDDEGGKSRKSAIKGASMDGDGAKKGKKRKLDGDAEKAPNAKKKKKDEPKQKGAKPKGPVDVERQCGVSLPNGGYCARSLTCKSHSMGLKRAVPGRSLPYDMLLAQYQKKNQAKIQSMPFNNQCREEHTLTLLQDHSSTQTLLFPKISSPRALLTRTKRKIRLWPPWVDTDRVPWQRILTHLNDRNTNIYG